MWGELPLLLIRLLLSGITPTYVGRIPALEFYGAEMRITPTYVGRIDALHRGNTLCRDHPHVCGENFGTVSFVRPRTGSPPRMWGEYRDHHAVRRLLGITPTYVGRITRCGTLACSIRDHPHVCGENRRLSGLSLLAVGSPPRMWGELHNSRCAGCARRITPTYVGRIKKPSSMKSDVADHPHVCGENFFVVFFCLCF